LFPTNHCNFSGEFFVLADSMHNTLSSPESTQSVPFVFNQDGCNNGRSNKVCLL
jgi:hypothetical protein